MSCLRFAAVLGSLLGFSWGSAPAWGWSDEGRTIAYADEEAYVAVIEDVLPRPWRECLPEEQIDVAHACAFGEYSGEHGTVSRQPHLWKHDAKSGNGIVCASILLAFRYLGPQRRRSEHCKSRWAEMRKRA